MQIPNLLLLGCLGEDDIVCDDDGYGEHDGKYYDDGVGVVMLMRVMVRITMRKRHCTDAPSPVAGKDKVEAGHETRHPSHATGNNNLVSFEF